MSMDESRTIATPLHWLYHIYFLFFLMHESKIIQSHYILRGRENITLKWISKYDFEFHFRKTGGRYFSKVLLNSLCKEIGKIYYYYKEAQCQSILMLAKNQNLTVHINFQKSSSSFHFCVYEILRTTLTIFPMLWM